MNKPKVTFTITSTNRLDLLTITIETFLKYNRTKPTLSNPCPSPYPIEKYILVEDSGVPAVAEKIKKKWPFFEVIANNPKRGQTASIDSMYAKVETPYIFHCEDDWEFIDYDFIDKSMTIMEEPGNEKIIQVWIRGEHDTNGHPIIRDKLYKIGDVEYYLASTNYCLGYSDTRGGFGYHPGLRRLSDYQLIGSYTQISKGIVESKVSARYIELGYAAATTLPPYVKHIGYGRQSNREKNNTRANLLL